MFANPSPAVRTAPVAGSAATGPGTRWNSCSYVCCPLPVRRSVITQYSQSPGSFPFT